MSAPGGGYRGRQAGPVRTRGRSVGGRARGGRGGFGGRGAPRGGGGGGAAAAADTMDTAEGTGSQRRTALYTPYRERTRGRRGGAGGGGDDMAGEVQMGEAHSGGPFGTRRGRGASLSRGGSRGGRGGAAAASVGPTAWRVQVSVPPGTSYEDILNHLLASHSFTYTNATMQGRNVVVTVGGKNDAYALAKLSGIEFHGHQINVRILKRQGNEGGAAAAAGGGGDHRHWVEQQLAQLDAADSTMTDGPGSPAQRLAGLVARTYNASAKMLDMSGLASRPELSGMTISFDNTRGVELLLGVISRRAPDVMSIEFAHNNIRTLAPFARIRTWLPQCQNLSFRDNQLADIEELHHLKEAKPRAIVLNGNPWNEVDPLQVVKMLPDLTFLNQREIPKIISFGVSSELALPPVRAPYADHDSNRGVALQFVRRFFQYYDSDRRELLSVYHRDAVFSLQITPPPPPARSHPQYGHAAVPKDYRKYLPHSRNMIRLTDDDARAKLLYRDDVKLLNVMLELPPTQHQTDYLTEVLLLPAGATQKQIMTVIVHGSFVEMGEGTTVQRSYDRVLLLTPSEPGSRAAVAQWPAVVLNDSLHVRPFTPLGSLTHEAGAPDMTGSPHMGVYGGMAAAAASPISPIPPALSIPPQMVMPAGLSLEQQNKLGTLMSATRLKPAYAQQLLVNGLWTYDVALNQFYLMQRSGQVPPEAYQ